MKSYSQLRNDYGIDTKNTSAANLTFGDTLMNDFHRRLLAKADWPFLHRLRTATTQGNTTFVNMPYDVDQVESVFVTVGSTRHNPRPAPSRQFWDDLHYSTQTSDTPEYWFPYNGQIGLWPRPASTGSVISINAKVRVIDLNTADITSVTLATAVQGSPTITVSGSLTDQMPGMWIRPTFSTTDNTGDGVWYEISSFASATVCTLARNYGGNSITAGTAATIIGQMPLLPEAFHDLPEIYAAYRYWAKEDDKRAAEFKTMLDDGVSTLFTTHGFNDLSMVLSSGLGDDFDISNPNLHISL